MSSITYQVQFWFDSFPGFLRVSCDGHPEDGVGSRGRVVLGRRPSGANTKYRESKLFVNTVDDLSHNIVRELCWKLTGTANRFQRTNEAKHGILKDLWKFNRWKFWRISTYSFWSCMLGHRKTMFLQLNLNYRLFSEDNFRPRILNSKITRRLLTR